MKLSSNFIEGITQAVWLAGHGCDFNLTGPGSQKPQKVDLIRIVEAREVFSRGFTPFRKSFFRHAHHGMTTGMGILNIENWIVSGLFQNLFKVKVQVSVA